MQKRNQIGLSMTERKNQPRIHDPVLLEEVVEALRLEPLAHLNIQARFIDATVGTGGHSQEIVKRGAKLLGIDADRKMLEVAKRRLKQACPPRLSRKAGRFKLVQGNFAKIDEIAKRFGFEGVDGIFFDLGVSSLHFSDISRGFSFNYPNAPLDMRVDEKGQSVTASDLLNSLRKDQLRDLFSTVMAHAPAKKLADKIIAARVEKPIKTVGEFLEVIEWSLRRRGKLHPATLPFLALRIVVNSELENLKEALPKAFSLLASSGRLVVVSFHSGEDRLVKKFFRRAQMEEKAKLITKKPILPGESEVARNPNSRSAKMRVLEKI